MLTGQKPAGIMDKDLKSRPAGSVEILHQHERQE
jgi:hypothetical protein